MDSPKAIHQSDVVRVPTTNKCYATHTIQGSGKIIYLDFISNDRGDALRITEVASRKRNSVMIPLSLLNATGLGIQKVIEEGRRNKEAGKEITTHSASDE